MKLVDDWFEKCDTNDDGKLTLDEAKQYINHWLEDTYEIVIGQNSIEETFQEIDKSNDQYISKEELFRHIKESYEKRDI